MEPFDTIDRIRSQDLYSIADVAELRTLACSYPDEPELWDLLGDVMQICDAEIPIQDSIECYRRALRCDASFAPAYESLGWALDSFFDDFENAKCAFESALLHGAGDSARIELARVLAQMGKADAARQCLGDCGDKQFDDWTSISREIDEGLWDSQRDAPA